VGPPFGINIFPSKLYHMGCEDARDGEEKGKIKNIQSFTEQPVRNVCFLCSHSRKRPVLNLVPAHEVLTVCDEYGMSVHLRFLS